MGVLTGFKAPDFTAPAVLADGSIVDAFNLYETIKGHYSLVFFYPLDFTFVCPSELIALDHRMDAFNELGVKVIGISVDSHFTHNAWRNTKVEDGGIGPVKFPLVADIAHHICKAYDVEAPAGVALRGAFLMDKEGTVRAQIVNDLPLGRNIDELIRLVEALQFHEAHGEVCQAGWQKGDKGMTPSTEGVATFLAENANEL